MAELKYKNRNFPKIKRKKLKNIVRPGVLAPSLVPEFGEKRVLRRGEESRSRRAENK